MEIFNFLDDEKEYLSVLAKILEENEMLKETVRSLISQLQEKEEQNFQLKSTRGIIYVIYCII